MSTIMGDINIINAITATKKICKNHRARAFHGFKKNGPKEKRNSKKALEDEEELKEYKRLADEQKAKIAEYQMQKAKADEELRNLQNFKENYQSLMAKGYINKDGSVSSTAVVTPNPLADANMSGGSIGKNGLP
jgi:hypothetical protein